MKLDRVKKICEVCKGTFEVIRCREHVAKYCSRKCYDVAQRSKVPWNKGRTYNELYDAEESERIKLRQHETSAGGNNPMYGKHHRPTSKKIMSDKKQGYIPWITGKKFPGIFSRFNRRGENNAYIKYVLKEDGITYAEYLSRLTDKQKYYREVIRITRLQNIQILENYEKRATAPQEHAHHLDHVYPVIKGFENNIPPEVIGDISNLRFIPWKENLHKSDKLLEEARKVLYENSVSLGNPIQR